MTMGRRSRAADLAEGGAGQTAVVAGGKGLVGIGYVDQVMRQAGAVGG